MKIIISESQYRSLLSEDKDWWYDINKKLKILKGYIKILKNDDEDKNRLAITYFIILHNFLIIERMFYPEISLAKKEINKFLELEKLNNVDDVMNKFSELYDINNPVRNNVELLGNIQSVGEYLNSHPGVFNKLIK